MVRPFPFSPSQIAKLRLQLTNIPHRPQTFTTLIKLFTSSQLLSKAHQTTSAGETDPITQIDFEESLTTSTTYQASYSKISASETNEGRKDVTGYVSDPGAYLVKGLNQLVGVGGVEGVRGLVGRCDANEVRAWVEEGRKIGLMI